MKLKYYLRGIGIGVIVATLVMAASSMIHNNNLSDEFIIKEAQKLGMVMPEKENDLDHLWGNKDTEENEGAEDDSMTEDAQDTENLQDTEDLQDAENLQNTESIQNTQDVQGTEGVQDAEDEGASEEDESAEHVQDSESSTGLEIVEFVVNPGDSAQRVARNLYSAGVIEDADDFDFYLRSNAYSTKVRAGRYEIPKGASYEEICKIIIRK